MRCLTRAVFLLPAIQLPCIYEYEDISTHPKMANRLAALRRIAEQIGLPTANLQRQALESEVSDG
ncbi:MAG: hypothetical protein ACYC0V_08445 [Armatimonadota bacterium]